VYVPCGRSHPVSLTPFPHDRMIPIMITRFTLTLKKEVGRESDEDILTTGPFNARPPSLTSIVAIRSDIFQTWRSHEHE